MVEFIIVGLIVIVAGYVLYSNLKKQANGDCGNGCKGCSHNCKVPPPIIKDDKIE
ncbi:FeoB-associated Cys-rich membrane protein [Clostridium sp.]|uniref:FeoB-associated Cys-rich membrane protein n=1 Tax=Clostridium sp. TaxID=1506 RepID=UPI003D6CC529